MPLHDLTADKQTPSLNNTIMGNSKMHDKSYGHWQLELLNRLQVQEGLGRLDPLPQEGLRHLSKLDISPQELVLPSLHWTPERHKSTTHLATTLKTPNTLQIKAWPYPIACALDGATALEQRRSPIN